MAAGWREYEEQTHEYLIRAEKNLAINSEYSIQHAQALASMANTTALLATLHYNAEKDASAVAQSPMLDKS